MSYVQSKTLAEIEARHPFPWQESRADTMSGVDVKMFDANGEEVILFELTALARIISHQMVMSRQRKSSEAKSPD